MKPRLTFDLQEDPKITIDLYMSHPDPTLTYDDPTTEGESDIELTPAEEIINLLEQWQFSWKRFFEEQKLRDQKLIEDIKQILS